MQHVLIVDDALDLGRLLQTALVMLDSSMPVVVVPSAEEAILEATRHDLDLLVSDLNLPGISGVELIKRIRAIHPDVHVIVITGMTDGDLVDEVKHLSVDAVFQKPMGIPEFVDAAKRCLQFEETEKKAAAIKSLIDVNTKNRKPEGDDAQLADVLSGLRTRLGALAVLLVDDYGKTLANSGAVDEELFKQAWLSELLTVSSSSNALSSHMGKSKSEAVSVVMGEKVNLVFAPVGRYNLLIFLDVEGSQLRLALTFEEALNARMELVKILTEMGENLFNNITELASEEIMSESGSIDDVKETSGLSEEELQDFEAALKPQTGQLDLSSADSFWNDSFDTGSLSPSNPDVLTFEEARQLGLTPNELD